MSRIIAVRRPDGEAADIMRPRQLVELELANGRRVVAVIEHENLGYVVNEGPAPETFGVTE